MQNTIVFRLLLYKPFINYQVREQPADNVRHRKVLYL